METVVVDAQVVGKLVDERDPHFVGEIVGVGEVRFERQPEERDPVRIWRGVGAPLGAGDAFVQAVQLVIPAEIVLASLLVGQVVLDDDGHLVEGSRERHRDGSDGAGDQFLERAMADGANGGGPCTTAALGHGARILGAMELPLDIVPAPDVAASPDGFVVVVEPGDRIHFLDWSGPTDASAGGGPGVLLIHGLGQTARIWTPVARRLRAVRRVVAMDLRGHGLSDAPTEDGAYDLDVLVEDAIAVAEGSGLVGGVDEPFVIAGHGFGAIVAAATARAIGTRCAGLVLVDGGSVGLEAASGLDVDGFLRGLDEPPEVMRSMDAFLADRAAFDPPSWDADQEEAARATVVETHAGKVVPTTRPHVLEATVRTMFRYEPLEALAGVPAHVVAVAAAESDDDAPGVRTAALRAIDDTRRAAGLPPIRVVRFPHDGHNLMRYRPDAVSAAILSVADDGAGAG